MSEDLELHEMAIELIQKREAMKISSAKLAACNTALEIALAEHAAAMEALEVAIELGQKAIDARTDHE